LKYPCMVTAVIIDGKHMADLIVPPADTRLKARGFGTLSWPALFFHSFWERSRRLRLFERDSSRKTEPCLSRSEPFTRLTTCIVSYVKWARRSGNANGKIEIED